MGTWFILEMGKERWQGCCRKYDGVYNIKTFGCRKKKYVLSIFVLWENEISINSDKCRFVLRVKCCSFKKNRTHLNPRPGPISCSWRCPFSILDCYQKHKTQPLSLHSKALKQQNIMERKNQCYYQFVDLITTKTMHTVNTGQTMTGHN